LVGDIDLFKNLLNPVGILCNLPKIADSPRYYRRFEPLVESCDVSCKSSKVSIKEKWRRILFWEACPVFALLAYAYLTVRALAWSLTPLLQIGKQRQQLHYEDLQQMHWERCVFAALPRQGIFFFLLGFPLLLASEYYTSIGLIADFLGDETEALVVTWIVRTIVGLMFAFALLAILGGVYFRIWRQADHERRYQRFRDETIIMNAAYQDKLRQWNMLRPARGTVVTRQKAKKSWAGLGGY